MAYAWVSRRCLFLKIIRHTKHDTKIQIENKMPGLSQSSWSLWPVCSVFMLLFLVVVLWFCSLVSRGVRVCFLPFSVHISWTDAMLSFAFTLPTCTLLLPGLTTSFSGSSTGMSGVFLLVLLIPCPGKGMVYAGRKILQSLEGLLH